MTCQSRFSLTLQFPLVQQDVFHFRKQVIFLNAHIIPKQLNSNYGIIFKERTLLSVAIKCFEVISFLIMLKQFLFLSRTVHSEINASIKNFSSTKPYITKRRENNVSLSSSGSMCGLKIGWLFTKKYFSQGHGGELTLLKVLPHCSLTRDHTALSLLQT